MTDMSNSISPPHARGSTKPQAVPLSPHHARESSGVGLKPTILLIEDDSAVREGLRLVLAAEGWTILTADTGGAALEVLHNHAPDLMITDLCLGAVSGWDLLFHESLQRPRLPIFVITGLPLHAMNGAAKFADECFQKPLDFDVLLAAVRSYLGSSNSNAAPPIQAR
jgi:two-component system response regulator FlrC